MIKVFHIKQTRVLIDQCAHQYIEKKALSSIIDLDGELTAKSELSPNKCVQSLKRNSSNERDEIEKKERGRERILYSKIQKIFSNNLKELCIKKRNFDMEMSFFSNQYNKEFDNEDR